MSTSETVSPAPRWKQGRDRRTVGVSLMGGSETDAVIEYLRAEIPDATVSFRDCYYKIERDDVLEFDMAKISEYLGHNLTTEMFLVNLSTYYGRMDRSNDKIQIFADIQPARFK